MSPLPFPRVNGVATGYVREGRDSLFSLVSIHQVVQRERPAEKGSQQLQGRAGV